MDSLLICILHEDDAVRLTSLNIPRDYKIHHVRYGTPCDTPILLYAAEKGSINCMRVILNHEITMRDKFTALCLASRYGHTDCVRILLDAGTDVNYEAVNIGLLIEALRSKHDGCVTLLVAAGINLNDPNNESPLFHAFGYEFGLKTLVSAGAKFNSTDMHNPFVYAISGGYLSEATLLADLYDWRTYSDQMVHSICLTSNKKCAKLVLEKCNVRSVIKYWRDYEYCRCGCDDIMCMDDPTHYCPCVCGYTNLLANKTVFKKICKSMPKFIVDDICNIN